MLPFKGQGDRHSIRLTVINPSNFVGSLQYLNHLYTIEKTERIRYLSPDPDKPIIVNVYPGADTTFSLYQDSGDGYAFEQGDHSLSLLAWDDSKQKLKLKAVKKSRIYNREIKVNVVKCFPTKP